MKEKKRLRHIWYGGPRCPRNTSKFKDKSSEDAILKEKMKLTKIKFRCGEATRMQKRLGRFRATCGYVLGQQPSRANVGHRPAAQVNLAPGSIAYVNVEKKWYINMYSNKSIRM